MTIKIAEAYKALFKPFRNMVYYGGRGSGKSWAFAQALLLQGAQKKLLILCTREFQGSIQDSVHRLLSSMIDKMGLATFYRIEKSKIIGANGTEFLFEGLKNNVTKIKSMEGVDICWCEESESISQFSWDVLIPTIRKDGSEIWVSFNTANEDDPTWQTFVEHPRENSYVKKVSWRDNPWFPKELENEKDALKKHDYAKYKHIWEGEFVAAFDGAYYVKEMERLRDEGRITNVPLQDGIEVNTFWDVGHSDLTVIWFHQRVGLEDRFIKCYANRLERLEHYARYIKDQGYNYGTHYLPHDANYNRLSTGKSYKEMLEDMGLDNIKIVERTQDVATAIEDTAQKLSSCWIDQKHCKDGIKALERYG
ncbi:MAG TPA: PBSX family phage terminase large subunit, partial [Porticoccaceae bacterium]|nr:PBSX family phage terminase large subunit [Porticoccaceae bacterium]